MVAIGVALGVFFGGLLLFTISMFIKRSRVNSPPVVSVSLHLFTPTTWGSRDGSQWVSIPWEPTPALKNSNIRACGPKLGVYSLFGVWALLEPPVRREGFANNRDTF